MTRLEKRLLAVWAAVMALTLAVALLCPAPAKAQDVGYYAQKTYTASGSSAVFAVPFPYITQSDVLVSVNGVLQDPSAYTFTAPSVVTLTATPTAGLTVLLKRSTSITMPKSVFNGGTISSAALNANGYQAVYMAQELLDVVTYISQQSMSQMGTLPNATTPLTGSETVPLTQTSVARKAPVSAFTTGLNLNPSGITLNSSGHAGLSMATSFAGNDFPAIILNTHQGVIFTKTGGTVGAGAADSQDVWISRDANYAGGTPFFTNSALRVSSHAYAGSTAFEWTQRIQLDNYSTAADAAQNVALNATANKFGSGSTWAFNPVLIDNQVNPSTSSVTTEMDLYATGPDNVSTGSRAILHLAGASADGMTAGIGHGIVLSSIAPASIKRGFDFDGTYVTCLICTLSTTFTANGIDLSNATYSGLPIKATGFSVSNLGDVTGRSFIAGTAPGVSCPANTVVLATLVVTNGIVTHC